MLIRTLIASVLGSSLLLGGQASAADLEPLRVANQKSGIKLLLEAAGELEEVPYRIDFSEFPAAAPLGEALNAGAVDIGGLGDAPYVFALGAGAPLKVVEIIKRDGRYTTSILVPKDSPLQTVADLKGQRIVTNRGSIGHFLVIKALREAGLKTADVTFVNLLPTDARSALESGAADAWSTWDPYTTIAITQNGARILRDSDDLLTNHFYLAATQTAVEGKRVQLEDFVKRVERAFIWANHNHQAYAEAQARVTGLPVAVHLESVRETNHSRAEITDEVIADLQRVSDIYLEEGVLTRPVDVTQGFDKSFNAARAEQPGQAVAQTQPQ
ncbi:ABC transporter substrate-binding protein [Phytopseudomonas dryadis]|uniref:Putative aliphatic sulfonates-binding protein n=1 Tax=Phytopseudomonas dryadis TaxID=2487520 RepID=A0A4Q9QT46_9GAMM|nr:MULTISPECIES: ABC transporter substrate-binding protein [Pseudomonas]TBU85642.1 aliphatic sulfonates ABC transporter substrate-binding protein [Pseudomonas dryadis]TBV02046.1 aliphatic sulfonates ABC transporter substrate-binding protein [Pseudomonas dryadis]TBV14847.1 aliphatic sulfonates ABC transporter substrate-binding protein [Pseudomonas sp. FRB 230]